MSTSTLQKKIATSKRKFCLTCGTTYDMTEFTPENPLECCGECGGDCFAVKSSDPFIGFRSIGHYYTFLEILPFHLRGNLKTITEILERVNYVKASTYLIKN